MRRKLGGMERLGIRGVGGDDIRRCWLAQSRRIWLGSPGHLLHAYGWRSTSANPVKLSQNGNRHKAEERLGGKKKGGKGKKEGASMKKQEVWEWGQGHEPGLCQGLRPLKVQPEVW